MLFWRKNKEEKNPHLSSGEAVSYYLDTNIKEQYLQKGFVIIRQFVPESILSELEQLTGKFKNSVSKEFAYSTMMCSEDENVEIHCQANQIVLPIQQRLFKEFKARSTTFLIKPEQSHHEMDLHQDWSFTDEEKFMPTTFWLPLQDVQENNGAVFFIPDSHRLFRNKRSDSLPTARIRRDGILRKKVVTASLKKGDLLLFNPAIFHGSHANYTNFHRIALTMTIFSEEAPFLYYNKKSETEAEVLELDNHALLTQMKAFNDTKKITGTVKEVISYQHQIPDESRLYSILNR